MVDSRTAAATGSFMCNSTLCSWVFQRSTWDPRDLSFPIHPSDSGPHNGGSTTQGCFRTGCARPPLLTVELGTQRGSPLQTSECPWLSNGDARSSVCVFEGSRGRSAAPWPRRERTPGEVRGFGSSRCSRAAARSPGQSLLCALHTTEPLDDDKWIDWILMANVLCKSWSTSWPAPSPFLS